MYDPFEELDTGEPRVTVAQVRQQDQIGLLTDLLRTRAGRAFFWMLYQEAGMQHPTSFSPTPTTFAFNEGRRSIGQWAENWAFTIDPNLSTLIHREAEARERTYERAAHLDADQGVLDVG